VPEPPLRFGMNPTAPPPAVNNINYSGQFANPSGYTTLQNDTMGSPNSQLFAGSDLLMTDVVSFEVRVLPAGWSDFADVFDMAKSGQWGLKNPAFTAAGPMVFDTWSSANTLLTNGFDYTGWMGGTAANGNYDSIPMWDYTNNNGPVLKAVQITLRVWDQKTELTRQVTIVVPL
jgi:hypothetical protein